MANIMNAVEEYLRETIDPGITDVTPKVDSALAMLVKTSQGVVRAGGGIGRNWETFHTYSGSLCGTVENYAAAGPDVDMDGSHNTGTFTVFGEGRAWPGLGDMAGPMIIRRAVRLVESRPNFPIPFQIMQSDRIDAAIGSLSAIIARQAAKRVALAQAHSLWKLDTENTIGTYTGAGSSIDDGTAVTLTSGRIRSFYPGLFLHLVEDTDQDGDVASPPTTDALLDNSEVVVVSAVNYVTRAVTLRTITGSGGSGTATGTAGRTVHMIPRNSTGVAAAQANALQGLIDWHKSSGTLFSGNTASIDLSKYPWFTSIVDSSLDGAVTSDILNSYIGAYDDAYDEELDSIWWSSGTQLAFLQNLTDVSQLIRFDVQGEGINVVGGFQKIGYVFNGRAYKINVSKMCPSGHVWVLKSNGNYMKYVPPRMTNAVSKSEFGGEVEFVGRELGSNGIFLPFHNSSAKVTDVLQAPAIIRCQFAPSTLQAIHLSEFDENIYTGS